MRWARWVSQSKAEWKKRTKSTEKLGLYSSFTNA